MVVDGKRQAGGWGRRDGGLVVENGVKRWKQGWVDDLLEIGSGVAGAPCSRHAVDKRGLMGMVVKIAGIIGALSNTPAGRGQHQRSC